jgi:hypothetical protein
MSKTLRKQSFFKRVAFLLLFTTGEKVVPGVGTTKLLHLILLLLLLLLLPV